MARGRRAAATALAAAVLLMSSGCDDDPAASTSESRAASPSPTPSPEAFSAEIDVANVAAATSAAGPWRYATKTTWLTDRGSQTTRLEGIVDVAAGRGWCRVSLERDGSDDGHEVVVWVGPDGMSSQQLRSDGSPDGQPQDSDRAAIMMLGWPLPAEAEPGAAGAEAAIRGLLEGQTFRIGTTEELDGVSVGHYVGQPREADGYPLELWVSTDDVIVQLAVDQETEGNDAHLVSELSDFGTDAEIPVPPDLGPE